jgi:hypothetical protein
MWMNCTHGITFDSKQAWLVLLPLMFLLMSALASSPTMMASTPASPAAVQYDFYEFVPNAVHETIVGGPVVIDIVNKVKPIYSPFVQKILEDVEQTNEFWMTCL